MEQQRRENGVVAAGEMELGVNAPALADKHNANDAAAEEESEEEHDDTAAEEEDGGGGEHRRRDVQLGSAPPPLPHIL